MEAILYSEVNVLCILFLLLIYFKIKNGTHMQNDQRLFRLVLIVNCIFFLLDIIWTLIDSGALPLGSSFNWTVNLLYYAVSGVTSYLWFLYSESMQGSRLVDSRKSRLLCALPLVVYVALCAASLKTGWLFFVDETNHYQRGSLYVLSQVFTFGYVVFTAVKALILSKRTTSYAKCEQYRTLAMFVVPTLISGIIQAFVPGISLLCVGTSIGVLYVYITMQEHMISVDALTGLNNRNRMMRHLSDRMNRRESDAARLYLILMDVDYFKQVNDKYGHIEGDDALRRVADALKRSCRDKHHFISRYGGDEFAAICELSEGESIEDVCSSIHKSLQDISKDCPYKLTLSIGYAKYDPSIKTDRDFIRLADTELYKVKLQR